MEKSDIARSLEMEISSWIQTNENKSVGIFYPTIEFLTFYNDLNKNINIPIILSNVNEKDVKYTVDFDSLTGHPDSCRLNFDAECPLMAIFFKENLGEMTGGKFIIKC